MSKLKSGEAKVEFFTNFDFIKSKYESGYVVGTKLYKVVQDEQKIKMKYVQFNKYFQEFIFQKDERFSNTRKKKKEIISTNDNKTSEKKTPKIKKIIMGEKKHKPYNPHTREINPKDIL